MPILIDYLQKDPNVFVSELRHDRLFLSAIDCTWYVHVCVTDYSQSIITTVCYYFAGQLLLVIMSLRIYF